MRGREPPLSTMATSGPPPHPEPGALALRAPDDLGNNRATNAGPVEKVVAEGRFELPTKGL